MKAMSAQRLTVSLSVSSWSMTGATNGAGASASARPDVDARLVRREMTTSPCSALICDDESWCAALYIPAGASALGSRSCRLLRT